MKYHKYFKCKRCGDCCTNLIIKLTKKDIDRIKKIGYKEEDFLTQGRLGDYRMKLVNNDCVFLRKNGKITTCIIHHIKPEYCRIYPSYDKNISESYCEKLK